MTQADKARSFAAMHKKGQPIVLYNIWDAGSAQTIVGEGATAVATGSNPLAAAQGYADGQNIPMDLHETILKRIVDTVDVPVSADFEGGYAEAPEDVAQNAARFLKTGIIGINFEDQVVGGSGLHAIDAQAARIAAIRVMADAAGIDLFINARTDLFLKEKDKDAHVGIMAEAKERAAAYAEAGASGFFAPGMDRAELIGDLCDNTSLPVNMIMLPGQLPIGELAQLGVARISFGPVPYRIAMKDLVARYKDAVS